jgi:hypothetical protein
MVTLPAWVITLVVGVVSALFGFTLAQDRRITRLEERVGSLGRQLLSLPKRRTDRDNG